MTQVGAPPEVSFDLCGRQKLASGFARYILCEGGCGYLIGVGDAIDQAWHESCAWYCTEDCDHAAGRFQCEDGRPDAAP